jgi:hypothetical protein
MSYTADVIKEDMQALLDCGAIEREDLERTVKFVNSQNTSLMKERDELAAKVIELEKTLTTSYDLVVEAMADKQQYDWHCRATASTNRSYDILPRQRAASLKLHDVGLLRKWAAQFGREAYPDYEDKFGEGHYLALTNVSRMLHLEANKIEEEADQ